MFTKLCRTAMSMAAVATMALTGFSATHAEETIDVFAREHLKASQQAQEAKSAESARTARAGDDTRERAAAKSARREIVPELLFIYGVENATVAYLRVDGRFGRNVSKGDKVGDWQVVAIGDDFVDMRRGGRQQRLLLPSAFGTAPEASTQASQRPPVLPNGDDL